MDNIPRCINCKKPIGHDSYLGFCPDCAIMRANPIVHTVIGIIAGIAGAVIFAKMDDVGGAGDWRGVVGGGVTFLLTAFGWNFITSFGFEAENMILFILKMIVSPFVGLVGLPVIIFRLIGYINRGKSQYVHTEDNRYAGRNINYHSQVSSANNKGDTWTCPKCGEINKLTQRICKGCGKDK